MFERDYGLVKQVPDTFDEQIALLLLLQLRNTK